MKKPTKGRHGRRPRTVRRSVALPSDLVGAALGAAPGRTFNGLVREALEQYLARRAEAEMERDLDRMAKDPQIQREVRSFVRDFAATEGDGLEGL